MYKLLIVDDEKIEREGMAKFIDWNKYDIEVVATAWNGQEAYEKVKETHPDIVLTDIKMPVMDGLALIEKLKQEFPDIEIVVLSGYGEYEYTSQAMEYGIRRYILKPCDEKQMVPIIEKVKEEIEKKRGEKRHYNTTMKRLLPLAKAQVFRDILLEREPSSQEYDVFIERIKNHKTGVRLLGFRNPVRRFDALEQFVIENILTELCGDEEVFMETSISEDVLFLIDDIGISELERSVERIRTEFERLNQQPIQAALSDRGNIDAVSELYAQIQELFRIGKMSGEKGLLYSEIFTVSQESTSGFFRYRQLQQAEDYEKILFEVYLAFLKMNLKGIPYEQEKKICNLTYQVLCEWGNRPAVFDWENEEEDEWQMICHMTDLVAELKGFDMISGKEEMRMKKILQAVFKNFRNTDFSIRYLAKEVLYMNEEHFGRVFMRSRNIKFNTWLRKIRIELAKELLTYDPEMKVSRLAELVGYSPDGQYFSKIFREETGVTPTEYCESLNKKEEKEE